MSGSAALERLTPGIAFKARQWLQNAGFVLFLLTLAWAPFPLGSNRPWAWALLSLLIATSWLLWCAGQSSLTLAQELLHRLKLPLLLGLLCLLWAFIQALPLVPLPLANWVWRGAGNQLGNWTGAVSIAPWRTLTEAMKLTSYGLAFILVVMFSSQGPRARFLFNALIVICGSYAAYSLVLAALGMPQLELFYAGHRHSKALAAPFVNRNSFATYAALGALCAGARLVEGARKNIIAWSGPRAYTMTLIQYLFGRGSVWLSCSLLCVGALLGTASRAGNGAFVVGALVAAFLARTLNAGDTGKRRARWIGLGLVASFIALVLMDGGQLADRLNDFSTASLRAGARLQLWTAALAMIRHRPFGGFGLGSFVQAFPIYDVRMMPFIMNKAHNDYLELAAGWGLPAAMLWWTALGLLLWRCLRGVYERRRRRLYPLVAVAASAAVGAHAIFDFSLQMPAIALTYATILGIGVAQAFPTRGA